MLGKTSNIQFCNHQRSSAGVSQSRKERCAGRLTSKAVDWDGRAGPGARAAGGSAAGAGGAEGLAAGARAEGSSCSRASWNSSPWFCGSCLLWYWACSLCCCSPCCCWCCWCWCYCCWCSCCRLHEARRVRFPKRDMLITTSTTSTTRTTSTTSTTCGTNSTYISQPAWKSPSVGEGSLPLHPLPLPAFLPLLPGAIKSASLHFLRAARTLNFNLMREARSQWPPATGFSPGRPESTF